MKRYRKKTELEIALWPIISSLGRMPTPKELNRILGGDLSDWGRILKGQQKISGEYHARLELLKGGVDGAQFELRAAEASKKYGERTRKGRIVPHTKNIYNDVNNFHVEQLFNNEMSDVDFEDSYDKYMAYREFTYDLYQSGDLLQKTFFEEQTIRRDFLKKKKKKLEWEKSVSHS
jgi:hypothetical protein